MICTGIKRILSYDWNDYTADKVVFQPKQMTPENCRTYTDTPGIPSTAKNLRTTRCSSCSSRSLKKNGPTTPINLAGVTLSSGDLAAKRSRHKNSSLYMPGPVIIVQRRMNCHMKKQLTFILLLAVFLITSLSLKETEAVSPMQAEPLHSILRRGAEKIFDLDTQGAVLQFQKAVDLDRENPVGYAFLALTYLFAYEMNFEQKDRETNQGYMLRYADEAVTRGENRLEKKPDDMQAHYAIVLAKIAKVRWAISQKRYTVIVQETSNMWDYCEKMKKEDPQNFMSLFPYGFVRYHLICSRVSVVLSLLLLINPAIAGKGFRNWR